MTHFSGLKEIGIKSKYKKIITVATFLTLTVLLMFPSEKVFAQVPTVQITSSQPPIAATAPYTQLSVPAGQSFVRVTFDYVGIEGNDRLTAFQCGWFGLSYASEICPNIISGQNTYRMTGRVTKDVCPGEYIFGVKVLNSGPNPNPDDPSRLSTAVTRQFTVTHTPPTTTNLDPTRCPVANIYKANSYAGNVPTSGQNQYHQERELPTPYNKMYIVFEGDYPTGSIGIYRSDQIDTSAGARTTFECRWDSDRGPFVPCNRAIIITGVSPGYHTVDIKARNAQGATGNDFFASRFTWCVRPQSIPNACEDNDGRPVNIYHPITMLNLKHFISEKATNDYFGKNETIPPKDLKEFSINNKEFLDNYKTTGAKNGNFYLKETPFINETIDTKNTFQNMTVGTNAINVTSLGLKDSRVSNASNSSLADAK